MVKNLLKAKQPFLSRKWWCWQTSLPFQKKIKKGTSFTYWLMLQKSGDHQLIWWNIPIIYKVLAPSKRWLALGFLNHQPYFLWGRVALIGCHWPLGAGGETGWIFQNLCNFYWKSGLEGLESKWKKKNDHFAKEKSDLLWNTCDLKILQ